MEKRMAAAKEDVQQSDADRCAQASDLLSQAVSDAHVQSLNFAVSYHGPLPDNDKMAFLMEPGNLIHLKEWGTSSDFLSITMFGDPSSKFKGSELLRYTSAADLIVGSDAAVDMIKNPVAKSLSKDYRRLLNVDVEDDSWRGFPKI